LSKKLARNIITHLNKFQKQIIFPVLIACLSSCVSTLMCVAYIYFPDDYMIFNGITIEKLRFYIPWILIFTSSLLVVVIFWTYYMSNKLVGPYERIMRDLDKIAEGQSKEALTTRKGDEMFEDLVNRINAIVKKIP